MKFIVYALVLGNLLMLGWLYQHRNAYQEPRISATQLPASTEPLVLLRERGKLAPAIAPAEIPAELSEQTELSSPAPTPAPVSEPMDGATTERIPPDTGSVPALETPMPATDHSPTRICQTIGPFTERQRAEAFVAEASGLGSTAAVRAAHIEEPSGYWVYLPSMSRTQAQDVVHDFEKKGVKDDFLGRQNFISLGVFTDKRSAEVRAQTITALGYTPQLEPRFLSREVYWVDLEESSDEPVSAARWDALMAEHTGIRRQPLTCE
ncbi:MAG: hypothetical protein HZB57_03685 [Gammaproteobacteria bacterium]|nr:hypothetical protein [Gammaproteobacteria bacterium]